MPPEIHPRVIELIDALGLQPHPEGGFYREIFRSDAEVNPGDKRGSRAALTTIYFLLPAGSVSRWHQVQSDEVWHLYEGDQLELLEMTNVGDELRSYRLGSVGDDEGPVVTIRAGMWQAARTLGEYTLVGCTVGPGFDFADFRMLSDDAGLSAGVRAKFPEAADLI